MDRIAQPLYARATALYFLESESWEITAEKKGHLIARSRQTPLKVMDEQSIELHNRKGYALLCIIGRGLNKLFMMKKSGPSKP